RISYLQKICRKKRHPAVRGLVLRLLLLRCTCCGGAAEGRTLTEQKAVLVIRLPIWPNPFSPTFTILSTGRGWHCTRRCSCLWNKVEQRA
ncbi:mCG145899, partial [Mus musculus]